MSTEALIMHDLRNDLCILKMLLRKIGDKDKIVHKITDIVNAMGEKLSFDYKRDSVIKTLVNVNDSINSVMLCYPDVSFENTLTEPLKLMANGSQLNDALVNIIKNSVEAGADKIKFEFRFNSLIIKDNGTCNHRVVDKLNNHNIFTTKATGSGLGTQGVRKFFESAGCRVLYFLSPNSDPVKMTEGLIIRIKLP